MIVDAFLTELFAPGSFLGLPSAYVFAGLALLQLLGCIGSWKVFAAAGRKPWHALVPGLYHYDLYDIAWTGKAGIMAAVMRLLLCLTAPYGGEVRHGGLGLQFFIILSVAHFVFSVIMKLKLSRSFDRNLTFAFGLFFMNEICLFLLGRKPGEYLGRTRYRKAPKKGISRAQRNRDFIITLYQRRSIIALAASSLVCVLTFRAIAGGLIQNPSEITPERGENLYKLFTVNSNTLSMLAASFMIPYAIEGVRRKRLSFPKWVIMLQYSGAICTTLTMIFALTLIWPTLGAVAVTGMNFWLHIICPILALVLLFSVETDDMTISVTDSLICLVPFFIYALVYIANVYLIGETFGGWRDIYRLITYLPAVVSAPLMFMLGFGVASLLRLIYNRLSVYRHRKLVGQWADDVDPVEVKVGILGIGRYNGLHSEPYNITLPLDMFQAITEKYDIPAHDLNRAYLVGVEGGVEDRKVRLEDRMEWLGSLIGIPEKKYQEEKER